MAIPISIWNLDFFRMFYKPYCLHPNLSIIQVMCLDYAVAMYPLLMIVLTYLLLNLHERFEVVHLSFNQYYGYLHNVILIINGMHLPLLLKPLQPSFYFHM